MKLGVFDSGIGGEAVALALQQAFPYVTIVTVNDKAHVPYGDKTPDEIRTFTEAAIRPLLDSQCDIIVLACNTATALAIEWLRQKYPTQKFIGIEPMIKTAASLTRSHVIAVCATPATLTSERYTALVKQYAAHLTILEPDCSQWAYWIENNQLNRLHVQEIIDNICRQGADVIVLGCTHYHWIKDLIVELAAGRAGVIEPSDAIAKRVASLIEKSL